MYSYKEITFAIDVVRRTSSINTRCPENLNLTESMVYIYILIFNVTLISLIMLVSLYLFKNISLDNLHVHFEAQLPILKSPKCGKKNQAARRIKRKLLYDRSRNSLSDGSSVGRHTRLTRAW